LVKASIQNELGRAQGESGDRLSEYELAAAMLGLLVAGHVTTVQFIGEAIYFLITNPPYWELLRRDPTLVRSFVSELHRYDAPLQALARQATADFAIGGRKVSEGDLCFVYLGAAHRDPLAFRDPNTFDMTRDVSKALSFGASIHACIGGTLAINEATNALTSLLSRFHRIELDPQA